MLFLPTLPQPLDLKGTSHIDILGHDVGSLRATWLGYQPFAPQHNNTYFPIQRPSQKPKFPYSSGEWLHRSLGWVVSRVSVLKLVMLKLFVWITVCPLPGSHPSFLSTSSLWYAHAVQFWKNPAYVLTSNYLCFSIHLTDLLSLLICRFSQALFFSLSLFFLGFYFWRN